MSPPSAPEGGFVRGGRFCTPPQAPSGTTRTVPPSRNISTPPKTNTPSRASRNTGYTLPQAPPEGDLVPGGCFCHLLRVGGCSGSGRVILSAEGDSAHPHEPLQAQREQFHPPATFPPPQRRIHPPERVETPATRSLKHRRRVIWYREGVFVRGGRFCALSQAVPGTTQTVPPSRDISTLQRRIHPPE